MLKNYKLVDLLNANVDNFTTDRGLEIRRKYAKLLKFFLKIATPEKIIVDNYPQLNKNEPYIFASTHGFSSDIIACLATIDRSAYLLMGSTNQIEYNRLMYAAWLNGFIYVNRLDDVSRQQSVKKMERVLNSGSSVLIFPEGGYNNTENNLCNKLFAGPYVLAKKTGCKVVPIAPFYEQNSDKIYMNYGEPIDLGEFPDKKEALLYLRDVLSTMVYENMEKHSSPYIRNEDVDEHISFMEQRRKEYLKNPWTRDVWDEELTQYLDSDEREYNATMETLEKVHIDEKNAAVMGPILARRMECKKHNFNNYMHNNWNKKNI